MGREQEPETFEWVNRWAENAAWSAPVKRDQPPNRVVIAHIAPRISKDQLARDMAEIERARDALDTSPIVAGAAGQLAVRRQRQALTLVAPRASQAACGSAASRIFHSCACPHAEQRARNVSDLIRSRVPISVVTPTSTVLRVVGQLKNNRSIDASQLIGSVPIPCQINL